MDKCYPSFKVHASHTVFTIILPFIHAISYVYIEKFKNPAAIRHGWVIDTIIYY
jgi:hypothetical protein